MLIALPAIVLAATAYAGSGVDAEAQPTQLVARAVAAETIDAAGQLAMGNAAYRRGEYDYAFRVYREMAVLGVAEAQYRLALMYVSGQGTRKSPSQAQHWMNAALERGYPGAAEALGLIRAMSAQG